METVEIRLAAAGDVPALVAIHRQGLPGDPLVRLGRRYLERHFYPASLANPLARIFVACLDGRSIGFHLCCLDHTRFHEEVFAATRPAIARALLLRPRLWPWAIRHALDGLRHRPEPPWAGEPEIFFTAVSPDAGRRAPLTARRLLHAGWDWLRDEGRTTCVCHIDPTNEAGLRLARGTGMVDVGTDRRGRRPMVVLRREL